MSLASLDREIRHNHRMARLFGILAWIPAPLAFVFTLLAHTLHADDGASSPHRPSQQISRPDNAARP
jgi:hypothetical protein